MRVNNVIGTAAAILGVLCVAGVPALAQQDGAARDSEKDRQRIETLEKKVAQLEALAAGKAGTTDEQVRNAVEKLSQEKTGPGNFRVLWRDGLVLEMPDKGFDLHIGGRLNADAAWIDNSGQLKTYKIPTTAGTLSHQEDGAEIRRMRLQMDGTIYQNTFFKLETDLAGTESSPGTRDDVQIKDAYVGFKDVVPFAVVQAGHFKEPFSLDDLSRDNILTFMERALPNAFSPDFQLGIQLSNTVLDGRATWAAGVFRTANQPWNKSTDQAFSQADGGYNFTGRVTGLPWYRDKEGETFGLLHVGAAGTLGAPTASGTLDFSARPEMHLASTFVDTGVIATSRHFAIYEGEAAWAFGPFSLQGEATQAIVDRTGAPPVRFQGAYAQASYLLTGEHRPYKKSAGTFDLVHPERNFGTTKDGQRGSGAWELAARYSYLDLTDKNIRGGRVGDVTLGLNWYLNPNVRIMLNYVYSQLLNNVPVAGKTIEGGDASLLGVRLQVDF